MFKEDSDQQGIAQQKKAGKQMEGFKNVNALIGKIHRCMRRFFESQMKKYDITPPQFEVLLTLWDEDGLVLSELGRRLTRDGPTITGIIDRMENKSLVKRKRSERDRRVIQVYLTSKAWEVQDNLMKMQQEAAKDITDEISETEIDALHNMLYKILMNIEEKILPRLH
ncbi:MAG: MarR family transcriptional regulator [Deltaproteobacteria bacterium]|nr:MarR family transcriptional regulator [Deltaproteobacteria bacterium]